MLGTPLGGKSQKLSAQIKLLVRLSLNNNYIQIEMFDTETFEYFQIETHFALWSEKQILRKFCSILPLVVFVSRVIIPYLYPASFVSGKLSY